MRSKPIFILVLVLFFFSAKSFAVEKLLFSVDLIRHGDRNPLFQLPKSILKCDEGLGELTMKGKLQETQLGAALRKKYVYQYHLLPTNFEANQLYVRSTDMRRTIDSANALLLGLYPVANRKGNEAINVDIRKKKEDYLLLTKPNENIYSKVKHYFEDRTLWKKRTAAFYLDKWGQLSGLSITNHQQLDMLADNLYFRKMHQLPLPVGLSEREADQIITLNESFITEKFKLKYVTQSSGHELLQIIYGYMQQVLANNTTLKYVLFSGHDSTILSAMNTLQAPLDSLPDYASHLNFSLFKNGSKFTVKVTLNDKPVRIPTCNGNICTLSQFAHLANQK